jgi:hypothetical protein
LGHVQSVRGPPEVAFLGYGDESTEMTEFHSLLQICNSFGSNP